MQEPATAAPEAGPRRSNLAGVVAALLPLFAAAYGLATFVVALDGPQRLFEALLVAAPFGYAVVGSTCFCALLVAGCLFAMAGRGTGIPGAVPLALAIGPWSLGLLGGISACVRIDAALEYAAPEQTLRLGAAGISESYLPLSLGAWCSGALLAAIALGLAIGARARRGEGRSAVLAVLGVLGLVAPGIAIAFLPDTMLAVPTAIALAIAVAIAAASIGRDGRSGAQASIAVLAAAFALGATALAWIGLGTHDGLATFAHGAPAVRMVGLSLALSARTVGTWILSAGGGSVALAALAVAAIAAVRARPTLGRTIGGVVAVAMLGAALAAHVESTRRLDTLVDAARPWDAVEGFTPIAEGRDDFGGDVHAIVTPERVIAPGRDPVAIDDVAGIGALLTQLRRDEASRSAPPDPDGNASGPALRLAIDARVPAPVLSRLVRLANDARFGALTIVGDGGGRAGVDAMANDTLIEALARGPMMIGTTVELERAIEHGEADEDPVLWHAIVGAGDVRLARRAPAPPVPIEDASLSPGDVVYLGMDPSAPIARVVEVAERLRAREASPVLVASAIPGRPERPLVAPSVRETDVVATRVLRGRVQIGEAEDEAGAGLFDSTFVLRTLRTRMATIQRCYESLLASSPTLGGRVVVRFTLLPSGTVSGVTTTESSGEARLDGCVTAEIARLRFNPGPEGGSVTYTYPFVLAPQP